MGADVLDRVTDLPAEERHEVDLVTIERVGLLARDRHHPEDATARIEWRDDARLEARLGELTLLRVERVRVHVPADDRLAGDHGLHDRAAQRTARAAREEPTFRAARVCEDLD